MNIMRIACLVSFSLRKARKEVLLSGKHFKSTVSGDEAIDVEIPFEIKSDWSNKSGPYGRADITFDWVDSKPKYSDTMEEMPLIELKTIDGWELNENDQIALESAGLYDIVMAEAFARHLDKNADISDIPKKGLLDYL